MTSEDKLQVACVKYVRYKYPKVLINAHLTGVKLPIGLATKCKTMGSLKSITDIEILEPRGEYHGCFIELKAEGVRTHKKNGLPATDHIAEQLDMIGKLQARGYYADIAVGFDDFIQKVDSYLALPPNYHLSHYPNNRADLHDNPSNLF